MSNENIENNQEENKTIVKIKNIGEKYFWLKPNIKN